MWVCGISLVTSSFKCCVASKFFTKSNYLKLLRILLTPTLYQQSSILHAIFPILTLCWLFFFISQKCHVIFTIALRSRFSINARQEKLSFSVNERAQVFISTWFKMDDNSPIMNSPMKFNNSHSRARQLHSGE